MYHYTSTCPTHPINSVVHLLGGTSCREESLQVWPGSTKREGSNKTSKEHSQNVARLCALLSNEVPSKPNGTSIHEEQEEEDKAKNDAKTEPFHGSQLSCFFELLVIAASSCKKETVINLKHDLMKGQ